FSVPLHQVIVDGDNVTGLTRPTGQSCGQTRSQSLPFARGQFRQITAVESQCAHELDQERPKANLAVSRLANGGQGGHQQFVPKPAAATKTVAVFPEALLEMMVGNGRKLFGQIVYFLRMPSQLAQNVATAVINTEERMDAGIEPFEQALRDIMAGTAEL